MIHHLTRLALPALTLLVATSLPACNSAANVNDEDVSPLPIESLDILLAERGRDVCLIDVREAAAYRAGHLPGAISLPLPELRANHPELGGADAYVVYASGPMDPLSLAAAKKLIKLGYAPVYDFRGGVELWAADGRELAGQD